MSKHNVYLSAVFVLLILSGWLSNVHLFQQPVRATSDLTKNISKVMGTWRLYREMEPLEAEYQGLETTDIIKRTYTNGEDFIHLIVAYIAHSNRKSAHAQEACLRGSGAKVGALSTSPLGDSPVTATKITINMGGQEALVYYWYKIGNVYTSQYLKSSFLMFLGGIIGKKQQGAALVRISTSISRGVNKTAAKNRLEEFTQALLPQLNKHLP